MSSSDCIEMDDSFMLNVNMRRDRCLLKLSQFYVLYTTKLNQIQFGPYL